MKHSQFSLLRLSSLLFCCLLAAVIHAANPPQGGSHRHISGTAYYADTGQPAEHIFVDLVSAGGLLITTATTTASGTFEFQDLDPEVYELAVHIQDYEPISVSIDLSFTSSYGNELVLHKRGEAAAKSAAAGKSVSTHLLGMSSKAQEAYAAGNDALYKLNKPANAIVDFKKAIKAESKFYEAYEALGWAYQQSGKSADAEDAFRKSIEVSGGKYTPADVGLGAVLLNTQRLAEGEKALRQAIAVDAKSWQAYYELGRAMLMQGEVADALKNAEQAKTFQPGAPAIYRLLANIHIRLHDSAALLADLDAYIKIDPASPAGQRARAMRDQLARSMPSTTPAPTLRSGASAIPVNQYIPARLN
jgi:tetratricopeptide (TPR) repeat protein